jgi:hypothetical protein
MSILFDLLQSADSGTIVSKIDDEIEVFLAQATVHEVHNGRIIIALDLDIRGRVPAQDGAGVEVRVSSVEVAMKESLPADIPKLAALKPS